jgi:GNAT superfamily N-acetyltransferase
MPALGALMDAAISELQRGFPRRRRDRFEPGDHGHRHAARRRRHVLRRRAEGELAGCGGWSRRATLYGGNQTPGRDSNLLDPSVDPARVRAMYTHPSYARRGVGRLILQLCESAAAAEGFTRLELMSTLSGEPLYTAYGFRPIERLEDATGGVPVPIVRMAKPIDASLLG